MLTAKSQTLSTVTAKPRRRFRTDHLWLHFMVMPALLLLLIYSYGPMFGLIIAFQDYNPLKGFLHSEFVGLENFRYIFNNADFKNALGNTFIIAVMKIVFTQLFCILIALLLNEVRKVAAQRTIQTMIYLPNFLSWIILSGILVEILSPSHGLVNEIVKALGHEPVFFLGSNDWFRPVILISHIWKEFGFDTIVYLAALTSVDPGLYETAEIDGATRLRKMWHVTLPAMRPIIVLLATLSLGRVLNAGFDQIFNLYSPITYATGDIIDTLVYRLGMVNSLFSISTAVGMFRSTVSTVLMCLSYYLAYKLADYRIF
ncbi:MAG: protein lplB [Paenibacillaceae bacterium]|jgi:putative aldouronate transport system permease protein|nr:protein lplB [Paenibacillaceae bacterium]